MKFQLQKLDGTLTQASSSPLWLIPKQGTLLTASANEPVYSNPASTDNTYRWDAAAQQYVYNWSTKGLAAGYWYKIYAKLDDGEVHSVVVGLR